MSLAMRLARPEIAALPALSFDDADEEPAATAIRLHANENRVRAREQPLATYPPPNAREVERVIAERLFGVDPGQLMLGRGGDEAIDLLVRAFCAAGRDAVMISPPTFGMYERSARIQGARVVTVPLLEGAFALDVGALTAPGGDEIKIVFVCSPNNPTGTLVPLEAVDQLTARFRDSALVVVDEAYVEFAGAPSAVTRMPAAKNLVVLRTLSKAWGLAGARLGAVIADPEIISVLRRVRPPYALTSPSIAAAMELASPEGTARAIESVREVVAERERVEGALRRSPQVHSVWPSRANFHLVRVHDVSHTVACARACGISIRDYRAPSQLASCVRITVGTRAENDGLLNALEVR